MQIQASITCKLASLRCAHETHTNRKISLSFLHRQAAHRTRSTVCNRLQLACTCTALEQSSDHANTCVFAFTVKTTQQIGGFFRDTPQNASHSPTCIAPADAHQMKGASRCVSRHQPSASLPQGRAAASCRCQDSGLAAVYDLVFVAQHDMMEVRDVMTQGSRLITAFIYICLSLLMF